LWPLVGNDDPLGPLITPPRPALRSAANSKGHGVYSKHHCIPEIKYDVHARSLLLLAVVPNLSASERI